MLEIMLKLSSVECECVLEGYEFSAWGEEEEWKFAKEAMIKEDLLFIIAVNQVYGKHLDLMRRENEVKTGY